MISVLSKYNKQVVQVQLPGQAHVIEISPEKIIEENLFEYFSTQDKKTMFSIVFNKNKLKVSDTYYCRDAGKEMLVLTDAINGDKMTIPASLLSLDFHLLEQVSPKEANKIGFLSGVEYAKNLFAIKT